MMPLGRRQVLPEFRRALGAHRAALIALAPLTLLLSVVPTSKSEIEAALLQQVDHLLRSPSGEWFTQPLHRLSSDEAGGLEGLSQQAAGLFIDQTPLWLGLASYLVITVLAALLTYAVVWIRAHAARDVYHRLRARALDNALLRLDAPVIESEPGNDAAAIDRGAHAVAATWGGLVQLPQYLLSVVVTSVVIGSKDWRLLVAFGLIGAAYLAVIWFQSMRLQKNRETLDRRRNTLVGEMADVLAKRETIMAHEQGPHYAEILHGRAREFADVERTLTVRDERYRGFSTVVSEAGRILVLAAAIVAAVHSAGVHNIGDAYFLSALYWRLFGPIQYLFTGVADVYRSEGTSRAFIDLLDAAPETPTGNRPQVGDVVLQAHAGAHSHDATGGGSPLITFSNVSFSYPDGKRALAGCSFAIPALSTTLIVGASGAGKTTIARILLGFLQPALGDVAVGSVPITTWSFSELCGVMGYVAQTEHVTRGTIADNLAGYGGPAEQVAALERVDLRYPLEAPAMDLSAGEKQRLAVARTLLDPSPIVIWDEPLTGVDAFTFAQLLPHVRTFLDGRERTAVVISHKLAFASCADHVVVLSGSPGSVVEQGHPRTLLNDPRSRFSEMYTAALQELTVAR